MSLGITPSQTVGPYLHIGLPESRELVPAGSPGALSVRGLVLDGAGEPVPDGDALRFDIRLQGDGETVFFAL